MSDFYDVTTTLTSAITGDLSIVTMREPSPEDPSPEELRASMPIITARQLRLALLDRLDEVESLIDLSQDRALQIEWEYATTFERLHPAIVSIGAALGLTPEQIDELWVDASNT